MHHKGVSAVSVIPVYLQLILSRPSLLLVNTRKNQEQCHLPAYKKKRESLLETTPKEERGGSKECSSTEQVNSKARNSIYAFQCSLSALSTGLRGCVIQSLNSVVN